MKMGGKGYDIGPTYSQIKAAMEQVPDCNETDIAELMELGLINQSQYEELMTIIHGKNDDFKSVPYNNFGYYHQQGPLTNSQTVANRKTRLKKVANNQA